MGHLREKLGNKTSGESQLDDRDTPRRAGVLGVIYHDAGAKLSPHERMRSLGHAREGLDQQGNPREWTGKLGLLKKWWIQQDYSRKGLE